MTSLAMTIVWDGNSPFYSWAVLNRRGLSWKIKALTRWVVGD